MSLTLAVKELKLQNGGVDFGKVFTIPQQDRLYGLVEKIGYEKTHKVLCVAIQLSMEAMNLSSPLSAAQIFDLVDVILESSTDDFLALEDVVLFLQKLVRGEAGTLFSRIDIPTFMERFETYRQERHKAILNIREEQAAQHKILGKNTSGVRERADKNVDPKTFMELWETQHEEKLNDETKPNND